MVSYLSSDADGSDLTIGVFTLVIPSTTAVTALGSSTKAFSTLTLDMAATHGGRIYFDAGSSTKYLGCLADGTEITTDIILSSASAIHTPSLLVDHIGEHTGAHTIVFDNNWTAASRTCADLGTVTTCDINGGTIDSITSLTAGADLDIGNYDFRATDLTADGELYCDHINELTGSHKIVFDNSFSLAGIAYIDHIAEATGSHKVIFDNDLSRAGILYIDHIAEATGAHSIVFDNNWTAASRTCADLGTVTTCNIDGGSIDGTTVGLSSQSTGNFTTLGATSTVNLGSTLQVASTIGHGVAPAAAINYYMSKSFSTDASNLGGQWNITSTGHLTAGGRSLYGLQMSLVANSTGNTLTNSYAFYTGGITVTSAVTNNYGFYSSLSTAATNNYAFYANAANGATLNYSFYGAAGNLINLGLNAFGGTSAITATQVVRISHSFATDDSNSGTQIICTSTGHQTAGSRSFNSIVTGFTANSSGQTLTTYRGMYINPPTVTSAVTNAYGIAAELTTATTNNYCFYANASGGATLNYAFYGNAGDFLNKGLNSLGSDASITAGQALRIANTFTTDITNYGIQNVCSMTGHQTGGSREFYSYRCGFTANSSGQTLSAYYGLFVAAPTVTTAITTANGVYVALTTAATNNICFTANATTGGTTNISFYAMAGDIKLGSTVYISDANNNELIKFTQTASAVNEITIANAATGTTGPMISATGETNVDLRLAAKGSGMVNITTGALRISNAPTLAAVNDTINIGCVDLSAGNTELAIYTEGTPMATISSFTVNRSVAIKINGTQYYLAAGTAAGS